MNLGLRLGTGLGARLRLGSDPRSSGMLVRSRAPEREPADRAVLLLLFLILILILIVILLFYLVRWGSESQIVAVPLQVPHEEVSDAQEDGESRQAIPQRRIVRNHSQSGALDCVVNDVRRQRILAESPEETDLKPANVAERHQEGVRASANPEENRVKGRLTTFLFIVQ